MDSYTYILNRAMCGYKLCNLQYRNEMDTDNRYKIKPIYAAEPDGDIERLYRKYQRGIITRKQYEAAVLAKFT